MKIRYLFYTAATIGLMSIGWYAHAVAYYVQDVREKAAVCDEIDCMAVKDAAKTMLANGLPVVR